MPAEPKHSWLLSKMRYPGQEGPVWAVCTHTAADSLDFTAGAEVSVESKSGGYSIRLSQRREI